MVEALLRDAFKPRLTSPIAAEAAATNCSEQKSDGSVCRSGLTCISRLNICSGTLFTHTRCRNVLRDTSFGTGISGEAPAENRWCTGRRGRAFLVSGPGRSDMRPGFFLEHQLSASRSPHSMEDSEMRNDDINRVDKERQSGFGSMGIIVASAFVIALGLTFWGMSGRNDPVATSTAPGVTTGSSTATPSPSNPPPVKSPAGQGESNSTR